MGWGPRHMPRCFGLPYGRGAQAVNFKLAIGFGWPQLGSKHWLGLA